MILAPTIDEAGAKLATLHRYVGELTEALDAAYAEIADLKAQVAALTKG